MTWDLPVSVEINGEEHPIHDRCDYRVILNVIRALNAPDLTDEEKIRAALLNFYEYPNKITDVVEAVKAMYAIIGGGDGENTASNSNKPKLMDWEHDFRYIVPPISRVLGYDIRDPDRYTHWMTFLGAYSEIGECTFATVVSIRHKRAMGKKLEKWEHEFIREHRDMIELPQNLTAEEQAELDSAW